MRPVHKQILCPVCDDETQHIFLGKGFPISVQWMCAKCGNYNSDIKPRQSVVSSVYGPRKRSKAGFFWVRGELEED